MSVQVPFPTKLMGFLLAGALSGCASADEPPAPAAPPPPAPTARADSIWVIDPQVPEGIRKVEIHIDPSARDTLVGLALTFPPVVTARDQNWFVRGEPLSVLEWDAVAEFVTVGTARVIDPEEIVRVGDIEGMPIFAAAEEVREVAPTIRRQVARDSDLDVVLGQPRIREAFGDVQHLYVPVSPFGAVFQAVARMEAVTGEGLPRWQLVVITAPPSAHVYAVFPDVLAKYPKVMDRLDPNSRWYCGQSDSARGMTECSVGPAAYTLIARRAGALARVNRDVTSDRDTIRIALPGNQP